jgi:hypothetical protein
MRKFFAVILAVFFIVSCSGNNNNDPKPGEMTFSITDSKPTLPEGVVSVFITVDEILVHKEGGEWINLPLKETPFSIDLLQYTNGETAEIVPPIQLEPGKYTQLRMTVSDAFMRTINNGNTEDIPLDVPSGKLRTDGTFDVALDSKGFIDMIIDFDLSQSIVAQGNGKYKLKPVLHLVEISDAVIFEGLIDNTLFVGDEKPVVTVYDQDGLIYTQVEVEKEPAPATDSQWLVYWIVPDKNYKVEIDYNNDKVADFTKEVLAETIPPGTTLTIE